VINLTNKDREIFELPMRVADIIKEYQTTKRVVIKTNSEGICLTTTKFYSALDYICDKFDIDKSCVTIVTHNVEETHPDYKIVVHNNHWITNCKPIFNYKLEAKLSQLTHAGCFLGKANWHRLLLSAWLHTNYVDKTLLTIHYDPISERHRLDCNISDINVMAPEELELVAPFLKHCPIVLEEGFINYTIGPPTHYNIIHQYHKIFVDIVSETYVSGMSFFPTEKTLRPIIAQTPFIVMGPAGYLGNLQRMGFQTFNRWWNEDYDNYSNYERLCQIKQVLEDIFKLDNSSLQQLLIDMQETLEYNRKHLQKIDASRVKLNEQK
jgi:hypothetical protein